MHRTEPEGPDKQLHQRVLNRDGLMDVLYTDQISSEPDAVFAQLATPVQPAVRNVLLSTIARRLTPQPIKLRADIELTCYTPAGIDAIKKALRAGEKQSTDAVPIKAKLVAPPLYVLSTNATDKVCYDYYLSSSHGTGLDCL